MSLSLVTRTDLIGRLVIDQQTTEELGHIHQLFVDSKSHTVATISCKSGFLGRNMRSFKWVDISSIGTDSVLISGTDETALEMPDTVSPIVGAELWTDSGNKVGSISNYCLDTETGKVTAYVFVKSGLQGIKDGSFLLSCDAVISVGRKRVIAQENALKNAEQFSSGLQGKLSQAVEFVKEDYAQSQADLSAFVSSAQPAATKLQESAQQLATQAKETAGAVQGQIQTTVHQVAGQVQETAASVQTKVESASTEEMPVSEKQVH
ncbi:MAG: PRC-barrel domain-containing protein [Cyanobacteria bacterium J06555_13]